MLRSDLLAWFVTSGRDSEALCVLSFSTRPMAGSRQYRNPRLLEWIGNGLRFWSRIQYADGSPTSLPLRAGARRNRVYLVLHWRSAGFLGSDLPADIAAPRSKRSNGPGAGSARTMNRTVLSTISRRAAALYHGPADRTLGVRDPVPLFRDRILANNPAKVGTTNTAGPIPDIRRMGASTCPAEPGEQGQRGCSSLARHCVAVPLHSSRRQYRRRIHQPEHPRLTTRPHSKCWPATLRRMDCANVTSVGVERRSGRAPHGRHLQLLRCSTIWSSPGSRLRSSRVVAAGRGTASGQNYFGPGGGLPDFAGSVCGLCRDG